MEKRVQYFENVKTQKQKDFLKTDGHCVLCSSPLEVTHTHEDSDFQIREQAYCVECDIRARVKVYTLN